MAKIKLTPQMVNHNLLVKLCTEFGLLNDEQITKLNNNLNKTGVLFKVKNTEYFLSIPYKYKYKYYIMDNVNYEMIYFGDNLTDLKIHLMSILKNGYKIWKK